MTNKLEISRELAEKCLDGAASMGWSIAEELRALLAAPVVDENAHLPHKVESLSDFLSRGTPEPSNKCGRCGASTVEGCNYLGCHFLESGNGAPVVGRQEPVAEVIRLSVGATAVILKGYEGMREGTKLYTEQPAPVAAKAAAWTNPEGSKFIWGSTMEDRPFNFVEYCVPLYTSMPAKAAVVYPSVDEVMKLVMNYQDHIRTNVTGTTNWAANLGMHIIDKVKELNQ